jgi:hypothetical protein
MDFPAATVSTEDGGWCWRRHGGAVGGGCVLGACLRRVMVAAGQRRTRDAVVASLVAPSRPSKQ